MKANSLHGGIEKIRELATKYDKQQLARMAQMGLVGANEAVMAGMMIDRIAQSAMRAPEQTVAQDVLQLQGPQMQQPPQGVAGLQQSMGEPPMAEAPSQGVAGLPSNLPHMAGGGIVAFADGDLVQAPPQGRPQMRPLQQFALPDLPTLQGSMDQEQEAQRMAGVDPNFIANMQKETLAKKGESEGKKNRAMGDALMMWGAGMLGARQGQEWVTASASAQQSLLGYKNAMDEIKDSEKEIDKASRELSLAEHQMKMGRSERALGRVDASKTRLFDAQNKQVEANNARSGKEAELDADLYKADIDSWTKIATARMAQYGIKEPTEAQWYVNTEKAILDEITNTTDPQVKAGLTQRLAGFKRSFADAKGKGAVDEATKVALKMVATGQIDASELGKTITMLNSQIGTSRGGNTPAPYGMTGTMKYSDPNKEKAFQEWLKSQGK